MPTIRIKATGLGAHDFEAELGKLTVVAAPCRTGKSSINHAVKIAALGYVPHLGKELASTAKLMRGRELAVTLQFPDGRRITRKLSRLPDGGLTMGTECSWVGKAKDGVHKAAAVALFGATPTDAEESLDVYTSLIRQTGPKRAARIQALLPGTQSPEDIAYRVARYLYQDLTETPDDRMPEDHSKLRPSIKGYGGNDDGPHTGQLNAVFDTFPMLLGKITEAGLGAARDWINSEKRDRQKEVREATLALSELKRRLQEIPEPNADELAEAETKLRSLEQQIGAAQARRDQVEQLLGKIVLADRKVSLAKQAAAQAQGVRAAFEATKLAALTTARRRIGEIDGAIGTLRLPAAVVAPRLAELEAELARLMATGIAWDLPAAPAEIGSIESQITALRARRDAIQLRAPVSVAAEEDQVAAAIRKAEVARSTFPAFIREQMRAILALRPGDDVSQIVNVVYDRAGAEGAPNVDHLASDIEGARRALAIKREDRDASQAAIDAALAQRAEITREIVLLEERGRTLQEDYQAQCREIEDGLTAQVEQLKADRVAAAVACGCERTIALMVDAAALIDYEHSRSVPAQERAALVEQIHALEEEDRASQADITETSATLRSAEETRASLGEAPTDSQTVDRGPVAERDELTARVTQMRAHRTLWDEHHRAVADLEARTDIQAVLTALEGAVKKVMAEEAVEHGGPLLEFMGRYLKAAGCSELPYIQATKDEVDFGWMVTRHVPGAPPEQFPVSLEVMCGSELTLYLTGLVAGIMALRNVEERVLLVEAESCDEPLLQQLLAGIQGIADEITAAIVNTPRAPATLPADWALITTNRASARAAA